MDIQNRIQEIKSRIATSAIRSSRKPEEITLLAVTKTVSVGVLKKAYEAGLREFGENRIQESLEKIEMLPTDIHWHLIGRLQTNKINKTLGKYVLIHSVDSLSLAQALSARLGSRTQEVLLEVNTSGETSKAGVALEDVLATAEAVSKVAGLKLKGLMTIGPLTQEKERQRDAFKKLKDLFEKIRVKDWVPPAFSILSMGMSSDFEAAIEEGSTLVRLGTALFGARD